MEVSRRRQSKRDRTSAVLVLAKVFGMTELVINVSNIISPLCYSLLRLEPYTTCPFRCVYCYSRWYMRNPVDVVSPRRKVLEMFEYIARKIRRKGLKPIPFRLSTLVDPFPPHEELYRFSEKIILVALKHEYPLIINTKSVLLLRCDEIRKAVEKLLDMRLAVLQVSISTLGDDLAKKLEPFAPKPSERLSLIKLFGERGCAVAVRISPFIPRYSPTTEDEIYNAFALFREYGVKHVIVESIRIESEAVEVIQRISGLDKDSFEGYSLREVEGMKPVIRISTRVREEIYAIYKKYAEKMGIGFATCKEGLFKFHTADDCCGMYLLKDFATRATLWDVYRALNGVLKRDLSFYEICKKFSRICGDELREYPREISKPLRNHEKKLLRVLTKPDILKHVAPHLQLEDFRV